MTFCKLLYRHSELLPLQKEPPMGDSFYLYVIMADFPMFRQYVWLLRLAFLSYQVPYLSERTNRPSFFTNFITCGEFVDTMNCTFGKITLK